MAIPTAPSATSIVTEALTRKLNGGTPAAADITRATDYGLEKVKRDIMRVCSLWKPLETIAYDVTRDGISKYTLPADCEQLISVTLMKGNHSDALSAVTDESNVTLATDEDASEDEVVGNYLLITSGTGVDQAVQVDDYNSTTKACVMAEAFATEPVATDGYLICDEFFPLKQDAGFRREMISRYTTKGTPSHYYHYDNPTYGHIELYPVPDDVWGIKFTYCADLRRVDLTSDLYTKILRRWAGVLEQGVYAWTLGEDDDRYLAESQLYNSMLLDLRARDSYLMNSTQLQRQVVE